MKEPTQDKAIRRRALRHRPDRRIGRSRADQDFAGAVFASLPRFIPPTARIFGFARTPLSDEQFRRTAMEHLTAATRPPSLAALKMDDFLSRCHYVAGAYDSPDSFLDLYARMSALGPVNLNTIFYMAVPSLASRERSRTPSPRRPPALRQRRWNFLYCCREAIRTRPRIVGSALAALAQNIHRGPDLSD